MDANRLNLFLKTTYSYSEEDRFTNAFLLVLQHSDRSLLAHFLGQFGVIFQKSKTIIIRDHLHYDSHSIVDGEICLPNEFVIAIESKIFQNQFRTNEQVAKYFSLLGKRQEKTKILLLISPDLVEPPMIGRIPDQNAGCIIRWTSWQQVYNWFN